MHMYMCAQDAYTFSFLLLFLMFCLYLVACGILVPLPGVRPTLAAVKGGFLTTRPPGKSSAPLVLLESFFIFVFYLIRLCHAPYGIQITEIHSFIYWKTDWNLKG